MMDSAIGYILFALNILGYHVRMEGKGGRVTFIATHRLAGHFYACTTDAASAYEAVCVVGEMAGLEQFAP